MDIVKSAGFWGGFAAALIVSLVIGSLIKGYPGFGTLLLISIAVSLIVGYFTQQAAVTQVKKRLESGVRGAVAKAASAARNR